MAIATHSTKKMMVKREVDVYTLELSADEFVSLRTMLGASSYTDIVLTKGLDGEDDKRIEAIYKSMTDFGEGK